MASRLVCADAAPRSAHGALVAAALPLLAKAKRRAATPAPVGRGAARGTGEQWPAEFHPACAGSGVPAGPDGAL